MTTANEQTERIDPTRGQMRFCILGSGGAGNCAFLQTPSARVRLGLASDWTAW